MTSNRTEFFPNGETASISPPAGEREIVEIPLDEIHDFPGHPFRVTQDATMEEMAESVRLYGVLVPALVRPRAQGGYEMISGHRRRMACRLAGLETMPCIVRELDDDRAVIAMVDSNLQRESLLPSEKAFAYRMKLEAARRQQGERSDLTSATVLQKSGRKSSRELLAENSPDSHEQIRKYIRLTYLIPALLERVDKGTLPMRSAVELSYLREEEQLVLNYFISQPDCTPTHAQAGELRALSEADALDERAMLAVLNRDKNTEKGQFTMPRAQISRFFKPGTSRKKMLDTIVKALEQYCGSPDQVSDK